MTQPTSDDDKCIMNFTSIPCAKLTLRAVNILDNIDVDCLNLLSDRQLYQLQERVNYKRIELEGLKLARSQEKIQKHTPVKFYDKSPNYTGFVKGWVVKEKNGMVTVLALYPVQDETWKVKRSKLTTWTDRDDPIWRLNFDYM